MLAAFAIVLLIIVGVVIFAARKSDACAISREIFIAAPAETVFPLVDNPRAMNLWNPFPKADPKTTMSYSGPDHGVGAINDFSGNGKVGAGRAEIIESVAPSRVVIALHMDRPMRCDNRVEFTVTPAPGGCRVVWAMSGRQPFIGKLMSLFIDMDKMVGGAFEQGLADLKTLAESA
jgi:uncharacterized protein YndB with AHSA1/START domain